MPKYVIVDKDNNPLKDELETDGLVIFKTEDDAASCIVYLIEDVLRNARRGLRVVEYDPEKHGVANA